MRLLNSRHTRAGTEGYIEWKKSNFDVRRGKSFLLENARASPRECRGRGHETTHVTLK